MADDRHDITMAARDNLKKFATSLSKYPRTNSLIVGHTDSKGTAEYNLKLSDRRAQSAVAFLLTQGVDRIRMQTSARGSADPRATTDTDVGRQQNGRLAIAIYATEAFRRQTLP